MLAKSNPIQLVLNASRGEQALSTPPSSEKSFDVTLASAKTPAATTTATTANYNVNNNACQEEWSDCWSNDQIMYFSPKTTWVQSK